MNYIILNAPIDHIFVVTRDKSIFGELDVIRQDRSKRDAQKFYRFHKGIGHDTSRCNPLKDVIEGLIRRGYFWHFIKVVDNARNEEMGEHNRWSDSPRGGQRAPPREEIRDISMIFGRPHIAVVRGTHRIDTREKRGLAQSLL